MIEVVAGVIYKDDKFLNKEIYEYISKKMENSHIIEKIKIVIASKNEINKEKFIQAYNNTIDEQIGSNKKAEKFNAIKQIWMLSIGIVFILSSVALSTKLNNIILEIIAAIGSFSIWESAKSWLVDRKILKDKKIKLFRLKKV